MSKVYSSKSNVRRAARKQLGETAKEDVNFQIIEVEGGFSFTETVASVTLATQDSDAGVVPAATAAKEAVDLANETGESVTVRDTNSDKILATVEPGDDPLAIPAFLDAKNRPANYEEEAMKKTAAARKSTTTSNKTSAEKAAAARKANPKRRAKRDGKPGEKVAIILRLASRKNGVTAAELNKETKWRGAPWKWLFKNPKGTGYADKFGYKFTVVKDEGETRYCLTPKG